MLISIEQQQKIKPIDESNIDKFYQIAKEVEESKIKELIGVALLQDLQANPKTADNKLLLDGGTFTDCHGNTISHKGLRYVIAYFNYAQYMGQSFVTDTFSGFVKKTRQDAENLTNGEITRLQGEQRSIGLTEWELIKEFLNENYEKYPKWISGATKKIFNPKFYSVRKTAY